jgi:hypothetical protein
MTIEREPNRMALHKVMSVTATGQKNVFVVSVDITDIEGERYICDYVSNPNDPFGLAPEIRKWLKENKGKYKIKPYVEPKPEVKKEN